MASSTESVDQDHITAPPKTQLEILVSHLLASKRSLSSINHVWRANEIVTSARSALEENVVISARTGFLRRGLDEQVRILRGVQFEIEDVAHKAQTDFGAVLKDLDAAEARLRQTLDLLRSTIVEVSFRPAEEEPKNLLDFVDERRVEDLKSSLKTSIDSTNEAQTEIEESNQIFDDDLKAVNEVLTDKTATSSSLSQEGNFTSPIPSLLQSLEAHAKEMAELLESLVRHFDLCVTAIKHTEGGGAAAQKITGDLPAGVPIGRDTSDLNAPAEPITDDERKEMMDVLSNDAHEVEDVVLEISDRITEMETQLEHVVAYKEKVSETYTAVSSAFHLLEGISSRLPGYITQSRTFLLKWNEEKSLIRDGMAELSHLRDFYEGFLGAYHGLIIEVARRRQVQANMEKVVRDAKAKLERLYEEDMAEREVFRQDQGDYLPSDIWPGLASGPIRFVIERADEEGNVPDLPRKVVEQALRRTSGV